MRSCGCRLLSLLPGRLAPPVSHRGSHGVNHPEQIVSPSARAICTHRILFYFLKCFDFPLPARRCVQCRHSLSALGQPPGRNSGMLTEHSSVCAASQARPRFCVESTCIQLQLFPKTDCLLMLSDLTENMAASARLFDRTSIKQCQGGVVIYDLMSGWLYEV